MKRPAHNTRFFIHIDASMLIVRSREPRASINTPGCGWAAETKNIGSVPDPFGVGAYTASDKILRGKNGLVHETTYFNA